MSMTHPALLSWLHPEGRLHRLATAEHVTQVSHSSNCLCFSARTSIYHPLPKSAVPGCLMEHEASESSARDYQPGIEVWPSDQGFPNSNGPGLTCDSCRVIMGDTTRTGTLGLLMGFVPTSAPGCHSNAQITRTAHATSTLIPWKLDACRHLDGADAVWVCEETRWCSSCQDQPSSWRARFGCLGSDLRLRADGTPLTDIAGYKIYYGLTSQTYDFIKTVSNQTTYAISGLEPGRTYYFTVTAYDASGNESGFSNEVSVTVPPMVSEIPMLTHGTADARSRNPVPSHGCQLR